MAPADLSKLCGAATARLASRIAWIVTGATTLIAITVVCGASAPAWTNDDTIVRFLWMLPVVIAACSGISLMRACRLATSIEGELLRTRTGDSWRKARPLVSNNPIAIAWNALIEQATGRSEVSVVSANDATVGSTSYLLRAVRSLPVGMAVTDLMGNVRTANLPLAAMADRDDADTLEGESIESILQINEAVNADDARDRLATDAGSIKFQLRRGENVEDGVLRVTRNRLAGRDGDTDGFVWLVQDITQYVIAAESRDQFLNAASHELRTPLANLKAYAEALAIEDGIDIEQQKKFCNIINDESTRLARLVDELLAVGQMEAGSMVLNRNEFDFSRILREAIEYIQPYVQKKQQRLLTHLSPKMPTVIGDKDKLQAALVNLLGNAVKYTPVGGEIEMRAAADEGVLNVEIRDSGIGIAPDETEKVFEKFYRAGDDRVSKESGNGLGLAFAREIVRRHSGDIVVESKLNSGSTFVMSVPVKEKLG